MGVEVLMVGALGWPTPTEDMGFWRPVLGELSLAGETDKARRTMRPDMRAHFDAPRDDTVYEQMRSGGSTMQ